MDADLFQVNEFICPVTGVQFVNIPGGKYMMGDIWGDLYEESRPVHEVTVKTFGLAVHMVTQGQWQTVMEGENPARLSENVRFIHLKKNLNTKESVTTRHFEGLDSPVTLRNVDDVLQFLKNKCQRFCGPNKPIHNLTWDEAQEFLVRLNEMTDHKYGYRLPSEAEWEYAARSAGTDEKWAGTNDFSRLWLYAEYDKPFIEAPGEVGQKCPNSLGLYDMSGGVSEWCQDRKHENYEGAPSDGSAWINGGDEKQAVHRGGAWMYYDSDCRTASRRFSDRNKRDILFDCGIGFRIARDLV